MKFPAMMWNIENVDTLSTVLLDPCQSLLNSIEVNEKEGTVSILTDSPIL